MLRYLSNRTMKEKKYTNFYSFENKLLAIVELN